MGERMAGRGTAPSTFPGRAGIPLLGWVAGPGRAVSFKEILKGQSVSLGLLPSLLPSPSSGRRERGPCCIFLAASQQGLLGTG